MELNLKRPIVFFDLETTGLNTTHDRIVEISILKVSPQGEKEQRRWLLNPEMPISQEASSVHGYTNEMVANEPTFRDKAREIALFIGNADLAGYNILKFDLPVLVEEFLRVDVDFNLEGRDFIDVMNIFMKMEPRTLKGAYRFFCHAELEGAHGAEADTKATYEVLKAMLDKYEGVDYEDGKGNRSQGPVNDMKELSKFSAHHQNADLSGQIIYDSEGKEVFFFGKHKGKRVADVFRMEPSYYSWMMNSDFPLYTKKLITKIKLEMGGKKTLI
ncbi:MAG: 3'-5' exonuclease [Bacteroidales bacterium]|nr:3'-5' exonuclease [Bacteroidales bacterium]